MTKRQVARLLRKHQIIRLDVGCGDQKQRGFVGLDKRRLRGVDIVHDLERTPWPLPATCCAVVILSHVWEHVTPARTLAVMAEIHRICRHDAVVMIAGPYGLGFRYQQDPTHCNPSNEATFCYWDPLHPSRLWEVYRPPVLHLDKFELVPVGNDRDFEVALRVCKRKRCRHGQAA